MSKKITLNIEWNIDKALHASKLLYDYDLKHSFKRYIGWLFIALLQFGIVASLKYHNNSLLILSSFLVGYWYYGRWWLRSRFIKKYYQKQNLKESVLRVECSDEGLKVQNEIIPWENILYAIDTKNVYLLQTRNDILYIPYNAFEELEDISECTKLLKSKGKL